MASRRSVKSFGHATVIVLRDVLVVILAALVVSFLMKTFLVRSFHIPTSSMEQTLAVDDRVIVSQLTPAPFGVSRGEIVVFVDPGGWLPSGLASENDPLSRLFNWVGQRLGMADTTGEQHLIKRVIGVPGDVVDCCDLLGAINVNGVALDEPYLQLPDGVGAVSGQSFSVTVPQDRLWVMGDNRYNSADSRANQDKPSGGFVPVDNVVGRAVVISWPMERWQWLGGHPLTFAGLP